MTLRLATIAVLALASAAPARDAPQAGAGDEIVVTGTKPSTLDLKRLEGAVAVFKAGRAAFAPQSTLFFQIRPKDGRPVDGMTLTLRQDGRELPVPIDAAGRFTLPDLPPGQWELFHNRGEGRIAVLAHVLSPGADDGDRPLGDLRLQCRVGWEMQKSATSLFQRAGFATLGGCNSTRINIFFGTIRPIMAASVTAGARTDALKLTPDAHRFQAPVADRTLPNAARVRLTFAATP